MDIASYVVVVHNNSSPSISISFLKRLSTILKNNKQRRQREGRDNICGKNKEKEFEVEKMKGHWSLNLEDDAFINI